MQCTRENYRFFVETMKRNGVDAQSIRQLLVNAWAGEAPSLATVYRHFAKDESSTEDQPRSGRPRTSITDENIEAVRNMLANDRHLTVDEIVEKLSISHGSAYSILRDSLNMTHVCSVWIPYDIGGAQKERRVEIAKEWLSEFETLEKRQIITIDEKWFFFRSTGSRRSNKVWLAKGESRPQVPRRTQSDKKALVIVAISFGGNFYFEVLPQHETVNSARYIQFLQSMHSKFSHSGRKSLSWKNSVIIHDNARPYVSRETTSFLTEKKITVWRQPAYSPDFNACDRWLFSFFEMKRSRHEFVDRNDLYEFLRSTLSSIDLSQFICQGERLSDDLSLIISAKGNYLNA